MFGLDVSLDITGSTGVQFNEDKHKMLVLLATYVQSRVEDESLPSTDAFIAKMVNPDTAVISLNANTLKWRDPTLTRKRVANIVGLMTDIYNYTHTLFTNYDTAYKNLKTYTRTAISANNRLSDDHNKEHISFTELYRFNNSFFSSLFGRTRTQSGASTALQEVKAIALRAGQPEPESFCGCGPSI